MIYDWSSFQMLMTWSEFKTLGHMIIRIWHCALCRVTNIAALTGLQILSPLLGMGIWYDQIFSQEIKPTIGPDLQQFPILSQN